MAIGGCTKKTQDAKYSVPFISIFELKDNNLRHYHTKKYKRLSHIISNISFIPGMPSRPTFIATDSDTNIIVVALDKNLKQIRLHKILAHSCNFFFIY